MKTAIILMLILATLFLVGCTGDIKIEEATKFCEDRDMKLYQLMLGSIQCDITQRQYFDYMINQSKVR